MICDVTAQRELVGFYHLFIHSEIVTHSRRFVTSLPMRFSAHKLTKLLPSLNPKSKQKDKIRFLSTSCRPILTTNSLCVYFVNDLIDEVRYVGAWWWGKFSLCRLWFSLFGTSNSEELVRWSVYAYGMEHTNNNDSNRWGWERRRRVTSERRDIEIQRELWKAWIFITSSQEWRWRQETRGLRSFHGEMVERMLWG